MGVANCPKLKAEQQATRAKGAQLMVYSMITVVSRLVRYPSYPTSNNRLKALIIAQVSAQVLI